jgi:hypothetical protein
VKGWAGAMENYTLKEEEGKTVLLVELDINAEYKQMFEQMFPKALEQVKILSESN